MPRAAILSFCPDLTDPNAVSVPLFRVSVSSGATLTVSYLRPFSEIRSLVSRDNTTLGIVQLYPWMLSSFLSEVGPALFLEELARATQHSSIFVERLEP